MYGILRLCSKRFQNEIKIMKHSISLTCYLSLLCVVDCFYLIRARSALWGNKMSLSRSGFSTAFRTGASTLKKIAAIKHGGLFEVLHCALCEQCIRTPQLLSLMSGYGIELESQIIFQL